MIGATGSAAVGVQRAATRPGDELMDPNAEASPGTSPEDAAIIAQIVGDDAATNGSAAAADPASAAPTGAAPTGAAAATHAAATAAGAGGPTADMSTGEQALFDQAILDPLRSLYAILRDPEPDFALAASRLYPIGMALMDYQVRFEQSNPDLSTAFMAVRGWLGRPFEQIEMRIGKGWTMSDQRIAQAVSETFEDLNKIRDRLP
jgi:hypothetical protein